MVIACELGAYFTNGLCKLNYCSGNLQNRAFKMNYIPLSSSHYLEIKFCRIFMTHNMGCRKARGRVMWLQVGLEIFIDSFSLPVS